jgi:Kef-type K+ transport system membrane component KefB
MGGAANGEQLVAVVLGETALITALAALLSAGARRLGQPAVIGQLLAGMVLGPSVLGHLPGHLNDVLFPPVALPLLSALAQVGLVLFMFSVGYELDLTLLRGAGRSVVAVTVGTFALPGTLGLVLYSGHFGVGTAHSLGFVLFLAVAVSITAVPVLAAIVGDYRMTRTVPGVLSMAAATVVDVVGWAVLAVAVAAATAQATSLAVMSVLTVVYVLAAVFMIRPVLRRWLRTRVLARQRVALVVALALTSAWATSTLGLHAIFGAVLVGLLTPRRHDQDAELLRPIQRAGDVLLPVFFVTAGLSADVGALHGTDFLLLVVILAIAVVGKVVGGGIAGRLVGLGWRDATTVGVLMNTRGLTELIALSVGRQVGLIDSRLYTILILMALITTIATPPLLTALGYGPEQHRTPDAELVAISPGHRDGGSFSSQYLNRCRRSSHPTRWGATASIGVWLYIPRIK